MTARVLLVALARGWFGTARIPRALALAGFEVSLFARKDTLAEHSGYLSRVDLLPGELTPLQWAFAFAATVREQSPRIVIACDDQAWIMLQTVAELAPPGMPQDDYAQLAALVRN